MVVSRITFIEIQVQVQGKTKWTMSKESAKTNSRAGLEPLAEVQRALLVVEVLKAPQPKLLGLLSLRGVEHFCTQTKDYFKPTGFLEPDLN
jgi:hypothetical protein